MGTAGSWSGKRIVVCGGTSGLGLEIVLAAARQQAELVIIGRDPTRLEEAKIAASKSGARSVICFSVDLNENNNASGDASSLDPWLASNEVHLLVNAIGKSDRGRLELLSSEELVSLFHANVACTWSMIRRTLHSLKRSNGVIVNIGSLAGLIATPNMGGYCISKFALTAMSRQLRQELRKHGVHVMIVFPGPIRRSDSGIRYQELAASRGLTDTVSIAPGGGAKLKLIDPVTLSENILHFAMKRKNEWVVPSKAAWLAALAPLWPSMADRVLQRFLRE